MFWQVAWYLFLAISAYVAYTFLQMMIRIWGLQKQGVVFSSACPPISDSLYIMNKGMANEFPLDRFVDLAKADAATGKAAIPMTGFNMFGMTAILINDYRLLEEFYGKKNQYYSKHSLERSGGAPLVDESIISMRTEDPTYGPKRKSLSAAFLKSKVQKMTMIIKEQTLSQIKRFQEEKGESFVMNIEKYFLEQQSRIIMATLCGRHQADQLIDYDSPNGLTKMPLWQFMDTILVDVGERFMTNPLAGFFPLIRLTGQDARYLDNAYRFRDAMRKIIEDKKKNAAPQDEKDSMDMFDVLIEDEYYKDKPEEIINEVVVMFAAGMKTIQISTTNVIQFLHFNPEYKKRLLEEIEGPLNEVSDDFMTKLTTDVVEDFSFTRNCFYESMRLHPPAPMSSTSCFSKDITINGVHFPKDSAFYINIMGMNRNTEEWQRPDEFLPDRFDSESSLYARPDGGKRNPLTFSPFLGGKRICLGKTFAETTIRLTLPLLYYHFDFEAATPDQKLIRYIPGGTKDPEVPFKVITKRKMTQKI